MMHEYNTMTQHHPQTHHYETTVELTADNATTCGSTHKRRSISSLIVQIWCSMIVLLGLGSLPASAAQPDMEIQQSLDAYALVEGWVRDWQVPDEDEINAEIVPVAIAIVTLRLEGKVFGRGSSVTLEPSLGTLGKATQDAIRSANTKLTGERDAMWESFMSDLASRITITIEIANTIVPMSQSELGLPGFGYTPGVLGVVVEKGNRLEVIGPESMLARNTDMTQSAMALANTLSNDASAVLESISTLAELGYSFYRFEPVVLAQPAESMGASFIDRGGRVVAQSEISVHEISVMSSKIAQHLMDRRWVGVERFGLMGTLDPVTGRTESPFANTFEQALGAYALLRYGADVQTKLHRQAIIAARDILGDLAVVEESETPAWDDKLGACMTVIALAELPLVDLLGNDQLNSLRTQCLEVLDGLYSESRGFDHSVPSGSHGLVAHALVRASKLDPRNRSALARSATDRVLQDVPAAGLVGQMPFLGWAVAELGVDETPGSARDALLEMRSLVWEHQLSREDLVWMDRDLVGGIVFTSSSTPLPSWIATKPLAYIASMLGDDRFTPGLLASSDVRAQIEHQVAAVRFIRSCVLMMKISICTHQGRPPAGASEGHCGING